MEKTSIKSTGKLCFGLLAFIFIAAHTYAKAPSASQLRTLTVKPDTDIFFTAQMNGFTLEIPGIEPSNVQTDLPLLPSGVKFVSSKKEEFLDENSERGTVIHLWFTFTSTGPIKLPPLTTRINNRTFSLEFEHVTVYENPSLISPVLTVKFDDETKLKKDRKTGKEYYEITAGEEIAFTVLIQYTTQILNFSWELPKNSIFHETYRWEIAKRRADKIQTQKAEFNPNAFPAASFVWKPLVEGNYNLPLISADAIAYNGSKKHIFIPVVDIRVNKASAQKTTAENSVLSNEFSKAFEKPQENIAAEPAYITTYADCKKIAELRSIERNSAIWNWKAARTERKNYETAIGILSDEDEPRFFLFKLVSPQFAIFAGGAISSVPEEKSAAHNLSGGQRVRITEKAGEWYYIECKIFSGWVKQNQIFLIN